MLNVNPDSALGLAIIVGVAVAAMMGTLISSVVWLLLMAVALPLVCTVVFGKAAMSDMGHWGVIGGLGCAITGIFLLF